MVGFLAQQLEVLPQGGEHVFVVVVMHTKMCLCVCVCVCVCVCEETQCHAFGVNRCVQSTELQ